MHAPDEHTLLPPTWLRQTVPHAPQLFASVWRLTSHPFATFASQLAKPTLQRAMPHTPAEHVPTPFAGAQRLLHVPQLPTSVRRSVSQPLAALPSQLPKPALQVPSAHTPPAHVAVALGKLQRLPHAPQLFVSVRTLASHPLVTFESQLAKPVLHEAMPQVAPAQRGVPLVVVQVVPQAPQFVCPLKGH